MNLLLDRCLAHDLAEQQKCTVDLEGEDPRREQSGAQCVEDVGDTVWLRNYIGVEVVMKGLRKPYGPTARLVFEHGAATSVAAVETLHTAHLVSQMEDAAQHAEVAVWSALGDMLPVRIVELVVFDVYVHYFFDRRYFLQNLDSFCSWDLTNLHHY